MRLVKSLGRGFAGTALLFSGLVGIGTSLVLLLSSCLGYLPYSDRPGPGWWGRLHWPSWTEFATYMGFAPWFAYSCLYFGAGLFALSLVLGSASAPRWLNRLLGGMVAAVAAGLAVLGAGWIFALAAIGADSALILGLLYGVFLFPRFVQPRARPLPTWIRFSSVTFATLLFLYWLIFPLLPKTPIPNINYDLVRVTSGDKVVVATEYLGKDISNGMAALNLRGQTHGGIGGAAANSGKDTPEIDVELIALEPITQKAQLAIPKTGYVIYVLKDGTWKAYPSLSGRDTRVLTIEPGTDSRYDGGRI
jgi:hypothetical protein